MVTKIGTCRIDGQMFTYQSASWHGKGRTTCDQHRAEVKRAQGRERVKRHRMNEKETDTVQRMTVHIQSCNHKSYCGRPWNDYVARTLAQMIRAGKVKGRLCKNCLRLFERDMDGGK